MGGGGGVGWGGGGGGGGCVWVGVSVCGGWVWVAMGAGVWLGLCGVPVGHRHSSAAGIYRLAALLNPDPAVVSATLAYARNLWTRLLKFEELVHSTTDPCSGDACAFEANMIWHHSVVWREVMCSLQAASWTLTHRIADFLTSIFGGIAHSKGVEDMFKFAELLLVT